MRHFVAYHKADDRGLLDRSEAFDVEAIGSKKSLKTLQSAIGSRIWLFEGRGTTTGNPEFSLAYSFIAELAEDAAPGEERQLSGSSVVYFDDEVLNDYSWFKRLKTEVANFSLGFQEVKNEEVVAQLEAFLAEEELAEISQGKPEKFIEGDGRKVLVSVRERSSAARLACIRHFGAVCFVCGFDFGRFYGKRAEGYIEVHHRKHISEFGEAHEVDPAADLVPLCANCHRVVHLEPPISVEDLKHEIQK